MFDWPIATFRYRDAIIAHRGALFETLMLNKHNRKLLKGMCHVRVLKQWFSTIIRVKQQITIINVFCRVNVVE